MERLQFLLCFTLKQCDVLKQCDHILVAMDGVDSLTPTMKCAMRSNPKVMLRSVMKAHFNFHPSRKQTFVTPMDDINQGSYINWWFPSACSSISLLSQVGCGFRRAPPCPRRLVLCLLRLPRAGACFYSMFGCFYIVVMCSN